MKWLPGIAVVAALLIGLAGTLMAEAPHLPKSKPAGATSSTRPAAMIAPAYSPVLVRLAGDNGAASGEARPDGDVRAQRPLQRLAQSCPAGYPVDCGDFCCEAGYSCETDCKCRVGYGLCESGGCCPADTPHTCPESDRCFRTLQDAIDGGCTWASVEVCAVRVR